MDNRLVAGYDPGGDGHHGVALVERDGEQVLSFRPFTLRTAEDVVALLLATPALDALGVDTLTCWSPGRSGWRPADRRLREQYPDVQQSVVSPNSLFGSMGLNGMAVVVQLRASRPELVVTETHPKVLYYCLAGKKYDYAGNRSGMVDFLCRELGMPVAPSNEHEWDAGLSALAALHALQGDWGHDLHTLPAGPGERIVCPAGPTQYCWP